MPHPSPVPSPTPPDWPHCGHGNTPENPVGCRGIHVPGHTACLAHLADTDRATYLTGLAPGDDMDHRGTTFAEPLLAELLNAVRDPGTGKPQLGHTDFDSAIFTGDAQFGAAIFSGDAQFGSATFTGVAMFGSVTFTGVAWFGSVTFTGVAWFGSAIFTGVAWFGAATFTEDAMFDSATFTGDAQFGSATFTGVAMFGSVTFTGVAWFGSATFTEDAQFGSATFTGDAQFGSVTFTGVAWFGSATFTEDAQFGSATFTGDAQFGSATFTGDAQFGSATFTGDAQFGSATFTGDAQFGSATFTGDAMFDSATFRANLDCEGASFGKDALFQRAVFERASSFGPLVCAGRVQLSGAEFARPVVLTIAARHVECRRTRWSSTAELRLRYATMDFSHAVFEYPLTIAAEAGPFLLTDGQVMAEQVFAAAPDAAVRIVSLRGVDAAHLVLAGIDLAQCLFVGTVHLDQLKLEGACVFNKVPPPAGAGRGPRFAVRRTLAEEQHWRAGRPGAARGWNMAGPGAGDVGPAQLEPVYRALRKAFEDSKNEPGAADFYYGEMEMRRHDREGTAPAERGLLHGYWALSGYGLRAMRAMYWLAATMLATVVLLMVFGIPQDTPKQQATGTIPAGGGKVTFEIDKDDPQNPSSDRFKGERFEKALNVTLNSVVFRSSGQDLTTAGTYIEMFSRVTEPVLLGLAVLSVRNRVKR
ncbi:pentapeptide repeat-containing protein [Streptomyces sp. NBC_00826]|uniref:pentapeptide repeat-containing protein n=1 Tax=Streptomyces sp. NBC_00826 TaxID=2975845 RepID=UPI002F90D062|nr:pentapeptide repeat-containing protein [Streptomyces sp. NBC_00826]WTB60650.1 pentapeptide repeat-containing protein [Streptomyces sp. NBC_00826]